ncbi:hypothetical protein EV421DRAFT_2035372 [Armillaria borealis]|uniref:BTB domain-containing protein n=1 Tax=Armillaria borealis TaxID=47425 RepID=A0AA39MRP3_9AGAR|nr:hypothetical protein EV421DRAFT_2035372 [Armillaria borealis]
MYSSHSGFTDTRTISEYADMQYLGHHTTLPSSPTESTLSAFSRMSIDSNSAPISSQMFAPAIPTFPPDVTDCGQTQTFVHGQNIDPAYYNTAPQAFPPLHNYVPDIEGCGSTQVPVPQARDYEFTPSPHQHIKAISTKFNADFELNGILADTQLISKDAVVFYVHRHRLIEASSNGFDSLLDIHGSHFLQVVRVPEHSEQLNIMLHAVYGISCAPFQPTIETILTVVCLLPKYGLQPKNYVAPTMPLFNDIRYRMPASPLLTYVISSNYDLVELAVMASAYLLSLDISTMSEEMVEFINPVYLKRLFDLQRARINALKHQLALPPEPHPATPECDFIAQKSLTGAWVHSTARLIWNARAGMTAGEIEEIFQKLDKNTHCNLCKGRLRERIKAVVIEWSEVKVDGVVTPRVFGS